MKLQFENLKVRKSLCGKYFTIEASLGLEGMRTIGTVHKKIEREYTEIFSAQQGGMTSVHSADRVVWIAKAWNNNDHGYKCETCPQPTRKAAVAALHSVLVRSVAAYRDEN